MLKSRIHFFIRRLTIVLLLACLSVEAEGSSQPLFYQRWMNLPMPKLIQMGQDFEQRMMTDSAIVCYTIVANRYDKKLNQEEKRICADAFIHMWSVYFLAYLDYPKSYECLSMAQDICNDQQIEIPRIDLDMGGMYGTIADICHDNDMDIRAMGAFRKAFWGTYRNGEQEDMNVAFSNLTDRAYRTHSLDSIASEWEVYRKTPFKAGEEYVTYNKLMYTAFKLSEQNQTHQALDCFRQQLDVMPSDRRHVRYVCQSYFNIAQMYAKQNNYAMAISSLGKLKELTDEFSLLDINIALMNSLASYYRANGNHQEALQAQHAYLEMKDSLLNYQQIKNMSNLEFLTELKKVDGQIQEAKRKKQMQDMLIVGVMLLAAVAVAFLLVVSRKNRKLVQRNQALYEKNVELLYIETEHRQLKKELQEERETIAQQQGKKASDGEPEDDPANEAKATTATEGVAVAAKYQGSTLSEEVKDGLLSKIIGVMENSEDIFSPDFSVERLAMLVGSRSKLVSQVINERNNFNFNTFVNNYRIKEALRRMNDTEKYGHYSVEGISTGVGFKSRTSFTSAFKHVTGLTPSEYIRIQKAK